MTPDAVRAFIAGSGPVTAFWRQKWIILRGFYRFALSRGFRGRLPRAGDAAAIASTADPGHDSSEELTRLLAATETLQGPRSPFRALLLLLYGTGMRIGEALSLTLFLLRRFLVHLEHDRGCREATRNQRLGAIHSVAKFIGMHSPEHVAWCTEIRAVPFKKVANLSWPISTSRRSMPS